MADGVSGEPGQVVHAAASTVRSAGEIAAELERLIKDAEAGGYESLVYLARMALYEARRLNGADGQDEAGCKRSA